MSIIAAFVNIMKMTGCPNQNIDLPGANSYKILSLATKTPLKINHLEFL
jgi:hypothetical protein